jgi:RNA polymerase sigma-70 factor (ECF subfamily)
MLEPETHGSGDLLKRMRCGDEQAFLALYRQHQGSVYRFSLHMSGSSDVAEEVTQEVFMALIRDAKRYDPDRGSLAAYLIGVARNLVLRSLESRNYSTQFEAESDAAELVADRQDIAAELAWNQRVGILRKAVLSLPPNYREVIVLCDLDEMDYAEAAAVLGCAVGTVRSRLHRARVLLAEKMRASDGRESTRCPA